MNNNDQAPVQAARRDWLAALMLRHHAPFVSRFAAGVARLRALPRGWRRRLRRRVAATAVGAALVLGLAGGAFLAPSAHAAMITVDEVNCTLVDAIRAANTDAIVGGCASGAPGLDTIELTADVLLTAPALIHYFGESGLPLVTSQIILNGNGHTIERDSAAPDFRILFVGIGGDMTLNDVTISGGKTNGPGGGFVVQNGTLTINGSTISGNIAGWGGGGYNQAGSLTLNDSVFRGNKATSAGGGLYQDDDFHSIAAATTTITNSLFELNEAGTGGGAMYVDTGKVTITDSILSDNEAAYRGGALMAYYDQADITISGSSLIDNTSATGGALFIHAGNTTLVNSTLSGNQAVPGFGGAIQNLEADITLLNTTITDNYAKEAGGGIYQSRYYNQGTITISRSIISGNTAYWGAGHEVMGYNQVTADDHNVFGHNGHDSLGAFRAFFPGSSDINASSDDLGVPLADILDTTLGSNGGPTMTHNLVLGSPALDMAPDADCAADPTGGVDQRGASRPFDVAGQGYDAPDTNTCDAGAVEYGSTLPSDDPAIYMSAKTAGTTGDGVDFDNSDILKWDGTNWSKVFDGTDAHLEPANKPKHNINAFFYEDDEILMSFAQNGRKVGDLPNKVDGMDLVRWDGSAFSLWFDGSDVGLTKKTGEKIDGLHVLPGDAAPGYFGGACEFYLLVSTQGAGDVQDFGGGKLKFGGEDVLGFCATNLGETTAGFWHLALDGSAVGLPKNSVDSISVSADGSTLYFTTSKVTFLGGHSMVFAYDGSTFSGPLFIAADNGLGQMVDGLDVVGEIGD